MKTYFFFAVLNAVYGVQSDQCGVDLLQLAIDVQDVSAVILEGTATLTYTVFEKELGPPPPELGIVIPPPRNVSFQSPDSMPIEPSSSAFYSSSSTSSSASTGISTVPNSSPTLIANVNTLLLDSPDCPKCSINPDAKYASSTGSPLNITFLYETLSKALNVMISKLQYNEFSSAIIEIAEEYLKACKASTRTSLTIYTLYDQLVGVRQSSASNKANLLRSILAKTLCSHTRNKLESANSADFFRSITDFEARNIFGFNFYEWSNHKFPTLAFVVDTTGSMANGIAGVRQAIKSIIALEQQNPFFYVLTPFNDYDRDARYRHVSNYGPNYIATTRSDVGDPYRELKNLYSVVSNLTADSGGDEPEYCMGGILEAMRASRTINVSGNSYNINFYSEASQMIVITDATAKDASLLSNVMNKVSSTGVKVHFILASESVSSYSPYQSIAKISGGLVLNRSTFEISKVIQTLASFAIQLTGVTPVIIATLIRNKSSVENCYTFGVSLFTSQISALFMQNLLLTYPNGTTTQIPGPNTFTVNSPDAGRWAVCSAGQVYYSTQTVVHFAVTFLDSKFSISEKLLSACTKGMVAVNILEDNAKYISPNAWLGLDLLNPDNVSLTTVSLVNCSGTYLGNVTYPEGIVTSLRLRGRDYLGYEFQYQRNTSSQLSFSANPCKSLTLVPSQPSGVVVTSGESRIFSFFISVIASTTPTEVRISTLSNSDKISGLVLMNGSVISSNEIATVRVNVSVSTLVNGTATASFTIQAHCGCNVNDAYEQVFQISSVMVSIFIAINTFLDKTCCYFNADRVRQLTSVVGVLTEVSVSTSLEDISVPAVQLS
ncbi:hypothetical protein EMCRGX_G006667 [Ephydatia muelleri]